jgi:hypothetical protein
MWKKKEVKKEEEGGEGSWLKELCGDDAELYGLLSGSLYLDPIAALPKVDLESLIEEAENSVKNENFREAMNKYRTVVNKALFEATQSSRDGDIKVIQDLASRAVKVIEKAKEKGEKEGFVSPSLEGRIKYYELMSERIEDVVKMASLFYNDRLEVLEAIKGRAVRRKERIDAEMEEQREEKESKEKRDAIRKGMKGRERREAGREDKIEDERVRERRQARRKESKEAEVEEDRRAEEEKERREARRKEK